MTPVERINSLISSLPSTDRRLASNLLNERKFEDLFELVKSDIYKHRKAKEDNKPDSSLDDMNVLLSEIISYVDQMGWSDEDIISDYEEY